MKCPEDCPVMANYNSRLAQLEAELQKNQAVRSQLERNAARNRDTARQLAALPNSSDVADARRTLQEAVVQTADAESLVLEAVDALHQAVTANQKARDTVAGACPGEPYYKEDPSNPDQMMIVCASPYADY